MRLCHFAKSRYYHRPTLQTSTFSSMVELGISSVSNSSLSRSRQMDQRLATDINTAVCNEQRHKRRGRRHAGGRNKYLGSRKNDGHHQLQAGSRRQEQRQPKNALMQLNELIPRDPGVRNSVKFRSITRSGPDHSPMYTASLEFQGQVYEGHGTTKKIAKQDAAERVISSLIQFRNESNAVAQLELVKAASAPRQAKIKHHNAVEDFTSDDPEGIAILFHRFDAVQNDANNVSNPLSCVRQPSFGDAKLPDKERVYESNSTSVKVNSHGSALRQFSTDKQDFFDEHQSVFPASFGLWSNPVAILNDLRPSASCRIIRDSRRSSQRSTKVHFTPSAELLVDEHTGPVVVSITVDGRQFLGSGRTLKSAKRKAATDVLHTLFLLRHIV